MNAAVLVELSPSEIVSPYAQSLLDACTTGMQPRTRCGLARDQPPESANAAIAIVAWSDSEHVEARIEVGVVGPKGESWRVQAFSFSPSDPEIERWRAVGLGIATLVGEPAPVEDRTIIAPESSSETTRTGAPSASPPDGSLAAPKLPRFWIDGGLAVGRGVSGAPPSLGGELRASRLLNGDRWFVCGSARYAGQGLGVDRIAVQRIGAGPCIGFLSPTLGAALRLELRAQVTLAWVHVSGVDPLTGAAGSAERWITGFEQGLGVVWRVSDDIGISIGGMISEATRTTTVTVRGEPVATVSALDWVGQAGLRVGFP